MSEFINNREVRKNTLKNIIKQLHEGKSVDEVKQEFEDVFGQVSAGEISEIESALVEEGMQVSEIQKLCDVHAAVFRGSIAEIHKKEGKEAAEIPGHPVNILIRENRIIQDIVDNDIKVSLKSVDDEIREMINIARISLAKSLTVEDLATVVNMVVERVEEMIFKEENIMIPMFLEKLSEEEWKEVYDSSFEIGFLLDEVEEWKHKKKVVSAISIKEDSIKNDGYVKLPSGNFKIEELTWVLNTLPFDITFVDKGEYLGVLEVTQDIKGIQEITGEKRLVSEYI